MYKHSLNSEWGKLFGLSPLDLTEEQLNKLDFSKLVEFISEDQRVHKILEKQLFTVQVKELYRIYEVQEELCNFSSLVEQYNICLRTRREEIDTQRDYYYGREKIIIWNLLNDENKEYEVSRWASGLSSIINDSNIDYDWLYGKNKDLADKAVARLLNKDYYSYNYDTLINLISKLPKDEYVKLLPEIFKKDKHIYIHSLNNPNTPKEYILTSLRAVAKLTRPPDFTVKLSNEILNELPPITRLEVLEKIMYSCRNKGEVPLTDVNSPEDLKQLVFSSTTRHYDRVSKLIDNYKNIVKWRNTNE